MITFFQWHRALGIVLGLGLGLGLGFGFGFASSPIAYAASVLPDSQLPIHFIKLNPERTVVVMRDYLSTNLDSREEAGAPTPFPDFHLPNQPATIRTNFDAAFRDYFASVNLDLTPPRAVFFNEKLSMLALRVDETDLGAFKQALYHLKLLPPEIQLEVQWYEISDTEQEKLGFGPIPRAMRNSKDFFLKGILDTEHKDTLIQTLQRQKSVNSKATVQATTSSYKTAHIELKDLGPLNHAIPPLSIAITNLLNMLPTEFETPFGFGSTLDITPCLAADETTIDLFVSAQRTSKIKKPSSSRGIWFDPVTIPSGGFHDARPQSLREIESDLRQTYGMPGAAYRPMTSPTTRPTPNFQIRQAISTAQIVLGQTLLLGSQLHAPEGNTQLLIIITPRLVDHAGKAIQPDKDLL